ncbi:hypothetical protein [Sandaracinus amylolyticus]|uniref:hypothetical protein n=1 Tax=Sandaracinus amylolyticus TaxID=927083 RepID=UPI001F32773A|nr:hypothetical protein [Sandaracinus amylolyticus]UJR79842.1 Tryptophan synthase alpha chain [Sandaracinus amylolyticus]
MRRSAWFVLLGAVAIAGSVGCGGDDDDIVIDAAFGDGGVGDGSVGSDSGSDGGAPACGTTGRVGGLCRAGACMEGLDCVMEFRDRSGAQLSSATFSIPQADPEDATNETFAERATAVPADYIPLTFATGSLCTEQCDLSAATDSCGSCARCNEGIGYNPLAAIGVGLGSFFETLQFGDATGLCRGTCTFDPETNGGCPAGYTCDAFTNLCLEACRNDAQCNGTIVIAESGNIATWIVPDGGQTCNATTGRCEWTNAATETVGTTCDSTSDCTADIGVCLSGGTCAETQCNTEGAGTDPETFACDNGRGICIGTPDSNNGAICIQGCTTSDQCNPGSACIPLGETRGDFSGYCLGICDPNSTGASDPAIVCGNDEQCDLPAATAEEPDPTGRCRATCDPAAAETGCEAGEFCEAVAGTTPAYGFCRALDSFCFANSRTGDTGADQCYEGQVCTGLLVQTDAGRCIDACTTGSCTTAGEVCVEDDTNPLDGLCAVACTMLNQATTCGADRVCRVATGATDGFCVRRPPA